MKKLQTNIFALCGIVLCGLLIGSAPTTADAQTPGAHPEYLHALRDLREARGLLQGQFGEPAHIQAAAAALKEINGAIGDIKSASSLDEKKTGELPPGNLPPAGRFHRVNELLGSARHEISGTESSPVALPYRDNALKHIAVAQAAIARVL